METATPETAPEFDLARLLAEADGTIVEQITELTANWHESLASITGINDLNLLTALIAENPDAQQILQSPVFNEETLGRLDAIRKKEDPNQVSQWQRVISRSAVDLMKNILQLAS